MNTHKKQYIKDLRSNSAYPTYRSIIGIIAFLGYSLAVIIALATSIVGAIMMTQSVLQGLSIMGIGLLNSAIIFILAKFSKEKSLIIADIGDSITEANSQQSGTPNSLTAPSLNLNDNYKH